jgi:DNA (cytosine-5)-methyltransferase 1
MRILDLYCGAGGAAVGIKRAIPNAEIIGVDIKYYRRYPFTFIQADAIEYLETYGPEFDFIWASPPCQAYSKALGEQRLYGKQYPDLVSATRHYLNATGKPYCIENVPEAPLEKPLMLCGQMFGLKILRHRLFETNFPWIAPQHKSHAGLKRGIHADYVVVVLNSDRSWLFKDYTVYIWRRVMQLPGLSRRELSQAVPPVYSQYIMEQWLKHEMSR